MRPLSFSYNLADEENDNINHKHNDKGDLNNNFEEIIFLKYIYELVPKCNDRHIQTHFLLITSLETRRVPRGLVVKAFALGLVGREFESRPGRDKPVLKMDTLAAVSPGVTIMRLVSGLVGLVSVYYDWGAF